MKDEHDKSTTDLAMPDQAGGGVPRSGGAPPACKPQPKRLPRQSAYMKPAKAKPMDVSNPIGNMRSVVPVSTVAIEWGISTRRVRAMLVEGRLEGRQLENGYWEVIYPYCYVFGTRGPTIKRQRNLPTPTRQKRQDLPEQMKEWF